MSYCRNQMSNDSDHDKKDLLKTLTPEQFAVTQQCSTEPPFRNAYWNHKEPGLYVDVVDGTPLFTSLDKFDSGTGWPSFTKQVDKGAVDFHTDREHGMVRTEVKSKQAQSHLGHIFDDGPRDQGGMRYCMNSASLRFVPVSEMSKDPRYQPYLKLFEMEKK